MDAPEDELAEVSIELVIVDEVTSLVDVPAVGITVVDPDEVKDVNGEDVYVVVIGIEGVGMVKLVVGKPVGTVMLKVIVERVKDTVVVADRRLDDKVVSTLLVPNVGTTLVVVVGVVTTDNVNEVDLGGVKVVKLPKVVVLIFINLVVGKISVVLFDGIGFGV